VAGKGEFAKLGKMDALLVFLKHPRAGDVKTRMIPALGSEGAAALYRVLAEAVLEGTRPRAEEFQRLLFFAPEEASAEIAAWFPGEALFAQQGEDLGERLRNAFHEAFRLGARRAVVIGTDCPALGREHILASLAALSEADVVLGPSEDGGYYLLALKKEHPELFHGIAWGSPRVLATTKEHALEADLSVVLLDTLRDVDTPEDVRAQWDLIDPLLDAALRRTLRP
jgi:rSAM/selenodomain-associated transferase 1